ncbi:MAG: energy-coupling factor transporter ATPase [Armatimonadota bacterium]|nr:energy-coupling factor transporter ATPase [Armatimonadota bacterium]MDR7452654.1 energy-coupling factor transporter ATPase [Armatimonadota bacterium]MDR7468161.1 energy-coupling factor transporter ATPase [Armatimonadota bacterium]MDR7495155.1 energy-coupling factor transporter ATPase [Armatimonadota bacterium]MDR7499289.1 energy-coupling factor transporter ATPase [Armatimonadota bacterium]
MAFIECEALGHIYLKGTPMETVALQEVTLRIDEGEFVALIGPTGSGKSTLVQHFNALLRPTSGTVRVGGVDLSAPRADLQAVRRQVGMLFQYPEHQLFEETVAEDVAFGPRNLGLSEDEVQARVAEALRAVGLDPAVFGPRSPFSLSGGEMRRVAAAGVLAMAPRVLILDEPAAGLDPRGKAEILGHFRALHVRRGTTIVLITHDMDEVAALAQRVIVLDRGRVVMDGPVREVFTRADELQALGLGVPAATDVARRLRARGLPVREDVLTAEEARIAIREALRWN